MYLRSAKVISITFLIIWQWNSCSGQDTAAEYSTAAIAFDAKPCAEIAMNVIRDGGNSVDAAVAGVFCGGLYHPHNAGVGGGLAMTIYQNGEVHTLNARSMAPHYANEDMFGDDAQAAQEGPFSMCIPGAVMGLWEAFQQYGSGVVTWSRLIEPSIDMCYNGIEVGSALRSAMEDKEEYIKADPGLSSVFIDPETGELYEEGDIFTWESLGVTLQKISDGGSDEFYLGTTAVLLAQDIAEIGGNMTTDDLANYYVDWVEPLSFPMLNGRTLYSLPPPLSGAVLGSSLSIFKHYGYEQSGQQGEDDPLIFHRMAEAFKFAFGVRSMLGDPADPEVADSVNEAVSNATSEDWALEQWNLIDDDTTHQDPEYYGGYNYARDHGTSHLAVLGPQGDAVSVTSTIDLFFGSKFMSPSTGIIMNDLMDDFSYPEIEGNDDELPPAENNFPKPGKRPQSSMNPSVILEDDGEGGSRVKMVVGASGGTQITTSTSMTVMRHLWLHEDLETSVQGSRIHHQLLPMEVLYEKDQRQDVLDFLASRNHALQESDEGAVVCAVSLLDDGNIAAVADTRKDGAVDGF